MKRYIVKQTCCAMLMDFDSVHAQGVSDKAFSATIPKGVYSEKDFKAILGKDADKIMQSKGYMALKNFIDVEEVKDVTAKAFAKKADSIQLN